MGVETPLRKATRTQEVVRLAVEKELDEARYAAELTVPANFDMDAAARLLNGLMVKR